MYTVVGILHNRFLISALLGWFSAQVIKSLIHLICFKEFNFERMWGAGGMPSSHAATVSALAVAAGLGYGFDDYPFAIAAILALVVMYDACGVRREAGEHARLLNELEAIISNENLTQEDKLKEFIGHTPLQVIAGALLGILVAVLVFLI